MAEPRLSRAAELFEAALREPRERRRAFVERASGEDSELRAEVLSLLAHHEEAGEDFLAAAPFSEAGFERAILRGGAFGRYKVGERLGAGGMGIVYRAEQENPRREVALKLLRPGLATPEMLERFAREAQVLGRLQHPGIAQILEAATVETAAGPLPWFALEYVRGTPLTEYAREHGLDRAARVELLIQVCEAVQHAHAKGVVHRDLKPANVLVDEEGRAKVLDFGVARAVDADVRSTGSTRVGELVGTLAYMSPEQAAGDPHAVDTRTDVYSLGVLGYELLSGRLPYDLAQKPLLEAARVIQETEPRPLRTLDGSRPGDLATILSTALRKDREGRYASPAALADDLRRALEDLPIAARPPSALYQLRKFSRRNRALVAAASSAFVLALAAAVVNGRLAVRLAAERDTAREAHEAAERARGAAEEAGALALESERQAAEQARIAGALTKFLGDVLSSAQPEVAGRDATVAEAALAAARRIDERFAADPRLAAALHAKAAVILSSRGRPREAAAEAEAAWELLRDDAGADPWAVVNSAAILGQSLAAAGDAERAIEIVERGLSVFERHALAPDALLCAALNTLGPALFARGDYERAAPVMRRALALCEELHGPDHAATLMARNNLAQLLRRTGSAEEAEPLLRQVMDASRAALGDAHPNTITAIYNQADTLRELGRTDEAEALFRLAIALAEEHLPPDHWATAFYRSRYGELLLASGRAAEAVTVLLESEGVLRGALGEHHERTRRAARALAETYGALGDEGAAEGWRARAGDRP